MPCSGGSIEMAPLIPVRMCVDLDQLLVVDEVETSKIKNLTLNEKSRL